MSNFNPPQSAPRLYARVWRWHFFAALIVIPFVLWQSATGVLYLWSRELASLTHPGLVVVEHGPQCASYQQQLEAVLAVRTKVTWPDFPAIPKMISLGIDLHEGHFFGRVNQVFNTLFAAALVWLSVTGLMGWYRRRPLGGLSPPPRRELRAPRAVIATGALLCIVLPLFGLSVLGIAAIDRIAGRFLARQA